MNFKGLALRLRALPRDIYFVSAYPRDGYIHVFDKSTRTWYAFREEGSQRWVESFKDDDFLHQKNAQVRYRGDGWYWPALVAALGLPVHPEPATLGG